MAKYGALLLVRLLLMALFLVVMSVERASAITFKVQLNGSNEAFAVTSVNRVDNNPKCAPCNPKNGCACGSPSDSVTAELYMTGLNNGSYVMVYTFDAIMLNASDTITKAHIHKGLPTQQSGGHTVTFFNEGFNDQQFKATRTASGVVEVDPPAYDELIANPYGYYLNIHSDQYAQGAIRGQLMQVNEPPTSLVLLPVPLGSYTAKSNTSSAALSTTVQWVALFSFNPALATFNYTIQLVGLSLNETITRIQVIDGATGPEAWDLLPSVNVTELALTGFTWKFNVPVANASLIQMISDNSSRYFVKVVTSKLGEASPTGQMVNTNPSAQSPAPAPKDNGVSRPKATGLALAFWLALAIAAAFGL